MSELNRVVERIRKLLAHSESAHQLGSADEAAAFATKATDLLLQHKLTSADITLEESAELVAEEPFNYAPGTKSQVWWRRVLIQALVKANFCEYIGAYKGVGTGRLIGKPSDVVVVKYLWDVLLGICERQARRLKSSRADKNAWRLGFATGVDRQLKKRRAEVEQQGGQFAMTIFNRAQQEVEDHIAKHKDLIAYKNGGGTTSGSTEAYERGLAAGERANLNPGIGRSTQSPTLAAGQRLLRS